MGSFVATSLNNPDRWGASWPPMGRKHGHQWGEKVAADGEKPMAIDRRAGVHARRRSPLLVPSVTGMPRRGAGHKQSVDQCERAGEFSWTRSSTPLPPGRSSVRLVWAGTSHTGGFAAAEAWPGQQPDSAPHATPRGRIGRLRASASLGEPGTRLAAICGKISPRQMRRLRPGWLMVG